MRFDAGKRLGFNTEVESHACANCAQGTNRVVSDRCWRTVTHESGVDIAAASHWINDRLRISRQPDGHCVQREVAFLKVAQQVVSTKSSNINQI